MRTIDKDALLSDIERTIVESGCVNHEGEIMDCVRYAPTIDAAPVVRGEWEVAIGYDPNKKVQCQNCYKMAYEPTPYCPACGAKMEESHADDLHRPPIRRRTRERGEGGEDY